MEREGRVTTISWFGALISHHLGDGRDGRQCCRTVFERVHAREIVKAEHVARANQVASVAVERGGGVGSAKQSDDGAAGGLQRPTRNNSAQETIRKARASEPESMAREATEQRPRANARCASVDRHGRPRVLEHVETDFATLLRANTIAQGESTFESASIQMQHGAPFANLDPHPAAAAAPLAHSATVPQLVAP